MQANAQASLSGSRVGSAATVPQQRHPRPHLDAALSVNCRISTLGIVWTLQQQTAGVSRQSSNRVTKGSKERWRGGAAATNAAGCSAWGSTSGRVSQCRRWQAAGTHGGLSSSAEWCLLLPSARQQPSAQRQRSAATRGRLGELAGGLASWRPHLSCANSLGAAHLSTQCQ